MYHDPELFPIEPSARYSFRRMLTNYIESFPRSTYESFYTRVKLPIGEMLLVCDPDAIEDVLVRRVDLFNRDRATRQALSRVLDPRGLFLAEGADWRWQRRAVAPTFRHETLAGFVPAFGAAAASQVALWRKVAPGTPIDIFTDVSRLTFDVVAKVLLGCPATLDARRFSEALALNIAGLPWEFLYALLRVPSFLPYPGRGTTRTTTAYLQGEAARVVAERRKNPTDADDLLGLLLAARDPETGRGMNDAELTANAYTFIVAGHDTSSVAISWTLWLLAKDQATQDRVRDEVAAVAGDEPISQGHVEKFVLTKRVLQESMRLFPPGAVMSRQAREDTILGPYRVARGTRIVFPIWSLHRHRALWPEPHGFEPDRFIPEEVKARPRFAHMPFGGGPRICIGASFAVLEMATIVASLVRAFRFRPVPGLRPRPKAALTLRPDENLRLTIEAA